MRKLLLLFCLFFAFQANSQTFNLTWSDEFIGENILPDINVWNNEVGGIRNAELQYYTDRDIDNQVVKNGNLLIIGKKELMNGYQYTSASLTTKSNWKYGKIEGNIRMQTGMGIWGCFWTLGRNISWPSNGEIDIIEHINSEAVYHTTAHWWNESLTTSDKHQADGGDAPTPLGTYDANNFNKYAIEWTPSYIKWFLNDVCVKTMSILNGTRGTWEFHAPQYILLNCPIGGSWPQSQPGWDATKIPTVDTMFVDYVRVYSYNSGAPAAPTSLESSSISQTAFTVNWSASSGATAYDVVLDNNGTITTYGPFSSTSCNITGLTANTNYAVRVKARNVSTNSSDLSELSNPLFVTTSSTTPPTPVVNLQFNENSGTSTSNIGMTAGSLNFKGAAAWSTNTPANNGIRTSAISISNNADAVETPYLLDQLKGLNDITITGWLNCKDATETGGNRIVNCLGSQWFDVNRGTGGFDLVYKTDGSLQLGINEAVGTTSAKSSANMITTDAAAGAANWKFFAVSYSASSQSVSFYFGSTTSSATLDKTVTYNKGVVGSDMDPLAIGNFNSVTRGWLTGRMFRGLIDQIQIYNSSLTLSQIVAVQNNVSGILLTSVDVTPSTVTLASIGSTTTLIATVAPSNATNQTLVWSSSNIGVATVSNTGVVTALSNGTATISATSIDGSNLSATSTITVSAPVSGTVYEAESGILNIAIVKSATNASNGQVVGNFETLNSFSKITNINGGTGGSATLIIRYANGNSNNRSLSYHYYVAGSPIFGSQVLFPPTGGWNNFADIYMTINLEAGTSNMFKLQTLSNDVPGVDIDKYTVAQNVSVTGVTVNPTSVSIAEGLTSQLTASIAPANATNQIVNWSSSNSGVATVNSSGLVTAVSAGSATVTATTQDGSFVATSSISVTVPTIQVTGVTVNPTSASITIGSTLQLTASVTPANATNQTVSWSSSNVGVATVNSSGIVTGVSVGTATITATTQDGGFSSASSITIAAPTNLALNKAATASSQASTSYTPAKAVDGNAGTQWRSISQANPWIYVDLGATYSINRVKLDWSTSYGTAYTIQVSSDATNWTTITTKSAQNGGTDDITGLSGSGRYVKINITSRSNSSKGVYLINFEVYGNTMFKAPSFVDKSSSSTVNVKVYPNPIVNTITIENTDIQGRIEICTLAGQVIMNSILPANKSSIDLSEISSGLYVLRVFQQDNVVNTFKIIKSKL